MKKLYFLELLLICHSSAYSMRTNKSNKLQAIYSTKTRTTQTRCFALHKYLAASYHEDNNQCPYLNLIKMSDDIREIKKNMPGLHKAVLWSGSSILPFSFVNDWYHILNEDLPGFLIGPFFISGISGMAIPSLYCLLRAGSVMTKRNEAKKNIQDRKKIIISTARRLKISEDNYLGLISDNDQERTSAKNFVLNLSEEKEDPEIK